MQDFWPLVLSLSRSLARGGGGLSLFFFVFSFSLSLSLCTVMSPMNCSISMRCLFLLLAFPLISSSCPVHVSSFPMISSSCSPSFPFNPLFMSLAFSRYVRFILHVCPFHCQSFPYISLRVLWLSRPLFPFHSPFTPLVLSPFPFISLSFLLAFPFQFHLSCACPFLFHWDLCGTNPDKLPEDSVMSIRFPFSLPSMPPAYLVPVLSVSISAPLRSYLTSLEDYALSPSCPMISLQLPARGTPTPAYPTICQSVRFHRSVFD